MSMRGRSWAAWGLVALALWFAGRPLLRSALRPGLDPRDPEEVIARNARTLIDDFGETGRADVAEFAEGLSAAAFDPEHAVFLIAEVDTGRVHVVHPETPITVTPDPDLPEELAQPLARAIEEAMPRTTGESFTFDDPPLRFTEIRLAESTADHVDFLLRVEEPRTYHQLRFDIQNGGCVQQTISDVDPEEMTARRLDGTWPVEWR